MSRVERNFRSQSDRGGGKAPPRRHRSIDFTVTGLVYCTMMSFMGIAASNIQANLLVAVFGLMVGMLILSYGISKIVLRRLSVRRDLPEHGIAGQSMNIRYEIENQKRFWPSLSVTFAELDGLEAFALQPKAYLLHDPAGKSAVVETEVMARRRGVYQLDRIQLSSSFPFGFINRALVRHNKDAMLIYPPIGHVDEQVIRMCRPAESAGTRMRPLKGGTDEFYGVKEYQPGENPRWIYWRRSARTGTLVSKEMSHVSPPRLLLLVDTFLPENPGAGSEAQVERVIAMAASLASTALEQGLPVGLVAWSDQWVYVAPNRGKRHRRDVLTLLARLPANCDHDQASLLDEGHRQHKSGTTSVLLTSSGMRQTLAGSARGNLVVLSSSDARIQKMFRFARSVDFAGCMPMES